MTTNRVRINQKKHKSGRDRTCILGAVRSRPDLCFFWVIRCTLPIASRAKCMQFYVLFFTNRDFKACWSWVRRLLVQTCMAVQSVVLKTDTGTVPMKIYPCRLSVRRIQCICPLDWTMPLCAAGLGHLASACKKNDAAPASFKKKTTWVVHSVF